MRSALLAAAVSTLTCLPTATRAQAPADLKQLPQFEKDRNGAYAEQLEAWLRRMLVDDYPRRAGKAWNRDYSSVEAFLKSVEPNREGWRRVLKPPALSKSGAARRRAHAPLAALKAEWVTVPLGGLTAEGIFAVPAQATPQQRVPLVIAQHGIGSFPEKDFGLLDDHDAYHSFAREMVDAGFAVVAPMNLRSVELRNRIERLCRLADTSLPGIELVRMQRLLDEVSSDPRIDPQRIGMWGLSLGGLSTMFWVPLEPRIKVAVVAGWFNDRRNKMVIPDRRYSCFLETKEEHAFFDGWLTAFTDSDVAALICPRPLLVQTGKRDGIAYWPMVLDEFETARQHYQKLGLGNRAELDLRDCGHETHIESGLRFLKKWL